MKDRSFFHALLGIAGIIVWVLSVRDVAAQNLPAPTTNPGVADKSAPNQSSPVQLSYGVPEILKLSRAHVSDDVVVAFVGNSGRIYNLTAPEILHLREEGVSDRVIAAMLDQRKKLAETGAGTAQPTPSAFGAPQTVPADNSSNHLPPAVAQTSTAYVQTAPASAPSSTVYVVPSSVPAYSYAYPYYGGYYGYGYPAFSLSLGFGTGYGGYYGGCYRGGAYYVGGGYHGGGYSVGAVYHGGGHH